MRASLWFAAIALAGPAGLAQLRAQPAESPEPEFIEYLGETEGMDPEIVDFMQTREAKRALKQESEVRSLEPPSAGVDWSSLGTAQQSLFAGGMSEWDALPPVRQRLLADGADRWLSSSDTDRAAAHARFETWRRLPEDDRERLRERWQQFRALTPEQKEALRAAYRRFLELPPERREAMLERWESMSPEERRRAIQRRQGPKPGSVDRRPCPPC